MIQPLQPEGVTGFEIQLLQDIMTRLGMEPGEVGALLAVPEADGPGPDPATVGSRSPATGVPFAALVAEAARRTGLDPDLIAAVELAESGGDAQAVSTAGATGLMQLMPATAAALGVDASDPRQNLIGGATYLSDQLQRFGGDVALALAAYNAGPAAVERYGGVPPYRQTQGYVQHVLALWAQLRGGQRRGGGTA